MIPPQIRPEALLELREAAEWYDEQRPGLGQELVAEFQRTLEEALGRLETSAPVTRTAAGREVRRFRLKRFSRYALYLVVVEETPIVLAFEHGSRRPGYWRERIE